MLTQVFNPNATARLNLQPNLAGKLPQVAAFLLSLPHRLTVCLVINTSGRDKRPWTFTRVGFRAIAEFKKICAYWPKSLDTGKSTQLW